MPANLANAVMDETIERRENSRKAAKARLLRPVRAATPVSPPTKPTKTTPLRTILEEIDTAPASANLTEAMKAAAWAARMCEHGWRIGRIMLVGRLNGSEAFEVIQPPLAARRPALDRFAGVDSGTPVISFARDWRREVWRDIRIDEDGADWLRRICSTGRLRAPRLAKAESGDVTFDQRRDSEADCCAWLCELMRAGPPTRNRSRYERDAAAMFRISRIGFTRAWNAAIRVTGATEWSQSGPKVKRRAVA